MKWVVGTGRCGMHNYTALEGGFIQSAKEWKEIAVHKYHGEMSQEEERYVRGVIMRRMSLPYPCVTDCAQFMFIDLIRQLDPQAKFIWLQRDRNACIEEFMARPGEDNRIHPKGWNFAYRNKRKLLAWYYDEVNAIIKKELAGADFEHIWTHDLPKASEESIEALRAFA